MIRVASALSAKPRDAAERVAAELNGVADLAFVFATPDQADAYEIVGECLGPRALLGCAAEWIVGDGREVEDEPAVSVWAASMPDAGLEFFRGASVPDADAAIVIADPRSTDVDELLASPVPLVGGLAAEGVFGGTCGVAISGITVRTLVSQGCRPIGRSFVVTRSERNVIHELAGQPALRRFEEVMQKADDRDRSLVRDGLFAGIVIDEYKEDFGRGDFLIRPVLGADPDTGAIAIGDYIEVGRTVQFQVRDAGSADEDLRTLIAGIDGAPAGALLFTCNGRGSRLFGSPDHDVRTIREALPGLPVAGFFCNGEIGPVGGRNFLHGFTASIAYFT